MQTGYRATWKRLAGMVQRSMQSRPIRANELVASLKEEDEHGLLLWCFSRYGAKEPPFSTLHLEEPEVFHDCCRLV